MAYCKVAWWLALFPGAALLGINCAFSVLGGSVRGALDPRQGQTIRRSAG